MTFSRWLRLLLVVGSCWLALSGHAVAAERWTPPLAGEVHVTRPFDPPATPYGRGHRGVDLAGVPGQPVLAAGDGTIGYAAPLAGRGVVTVGHADGLRTTYEPVSASVVVGQAVAAGQEIGRLEAGHAGCPVSACLHWGLRRGEVYLDPMSMLQPGPIRLLPRADSGVDGRPAVAGSDATPFGSSDETAGPPAAPGPALDDPSVAGGSAADTDRLPVALTAAAGLALGAGLLVLPRAKPP